jgi:hypothetical protein
MGNAQR